LVTEIGGAKMKFGVLPTAVIITLSLISIVSCRGRPEQDAYEYQCGSNIRQLAIACHAFALKNDGNLPDEVQQLADYLPSYWGDEGFNKRPLDQGSEVNTKAQSNEYTRDVKIEKIRQITDDDSIEDFHSNLFISDKGTYMIIDIGNIDIDVREKGVLDTSGRRLLPYATRFYGKHGYRYDVLYYHGSWDEKNCAFIAGQDVSVATVTRFHSLGFQEILWICDGQGKSLLEGHIGIDFVNGNRVIHDMNGKPVMYLDQTGKILESSHELPCWWNPNAASMLRQDAQRDLDRFRCPLDTKEAISSYETVVKGNINTIKDPASTVLIREIQNTHSGKRWVAFVDGHIELRED
jgi:prepilin-type processing-associated H-X9-DG protein